MCRLRSNAACSADWVAVDGPTHLKTTVVNRTYDLSYCRQNRAVICVRNSSSSQRIPVANVSFMDLTYTFIGSGEHDVGYLSGEMTLHALEGVFPTSNPTPVPTLYPTPRPTMKPTKGKKKNPPKPTMSPTAPSAVPTQTPTISPADICDSQPLARRKYNLEPNRIHFVAVTGSYREYKRAQILTSDLSINLVVPWMTGSRTLNGKRLFAGG